MQSQGPQPPNPYDKWTHLRVGQSAADAIDAFKAMARAESKDQNSETTNLPAAHPRSSISKFVRVSFDLTEPSGDHDHCLFKSVEDSTGRSKKGQRRPQDFQADRAETIGFIPLVLREPDAVYSDKNEPWKLAYICQTGLDEQYIVLVHERQMGLPRYSFITAYPMTTAEWGAKKKRFKLLRSSDQ